MVRTSTLMVLTKSITLDVPKEPAIRRAWVHYQLRVRQTSLRRIADAEGVCVSALANALMMPSSHLEDAIAKAIGLRVQELFPERFDSSGQRIHRTRQQSRSRPAPTRNVKDGRAA